MSRNTTTNSTSNSGVNGTLETFFGGAPADAQAQAGIQVRAFVLNLAISLGLFALEIGAFFILKSSAIGRRI